MLVKCFIPRKTQKNIESEDFDQHLECAAPNAGQKMQQIQKQTQSLFKDRMTIIVI